MIVRWDPDNWQTSNVVQLDSNAPTNIAAIKEIDEWAAERGFARVNEYWLRQAIGRDGKRVFRGVCYRLTEEEGKASEERARQVEETLSRLPVTPHRSGTDD